MSTPQDPTSRYPTLRRPTFARNVVSTSQPLASQAGVRMLLKGGNAVDAALATAITLTIVEPISNGIGSDAFAIVWDGKQLHGLNASGRAPAGVDAGVLRRGQGADARLERGDGARRGRRVARPLGALRPLPFADLFEPAIDYARNGFLVSPVRRAPLGHADRRARAASRVTRRRSCPTAARRTRAKCSSCPRRRARSS